MICDMLRRVLQCYVVMHFCVMFCVHIFHINIIYIYMCVFAHYYSKTVVEMYAQMVHIYIIQTRMNIYIYICAHIICIFTYIAM